MTVEVWSRAGEYEAVELIPSPLGGYLLPCTGPYRFTGTVGEGTEFAGHSAGGGAGGLPPPRGIYGRRRRKRRAHHPKTRS